MESLKTIHRIFFGFDGSPDPYLDYLKTWEEQLPDYEIKYWGKNNLPLDLNEYTRSLYKERDHAYLSDYFRWWVLREYGGVYLDADIEVVNGSLFNQLVESLENTKDYHAFIAVEELDGLNYTAHSMACKKNCEFSNFICNLYENMGALRYLRTADYMPLAAPSIAKLYFMDAIKGGVSDIEKPEVHKDVMIYPKDYFSPLGVSHAIHHSNGTHNMYFKLHNYSHNTCLCHHFSSSWVKGRNQSKQMFYQDYSEQKAIKTSKVYIFWNKLGYYRRNPLGIKSSIKMLIYGSISLSVSLLNKFLQIIGIGKKF